MNVVPTAALMAHRPSCFARQIRSNRSCEADAVVQGGGHAGGHIRSRLPVDAAHRAAAGVVVAAAACVAHQIVDDA
jgi:hypothetical protein